MKKHHEDHYGNKSVLEVDQSSSLLTVGDRTYRWSWELSLDSWGDQQRVRCWERISGRSSKDVTSRKRIKHLNKLLKRALDEHEATQKAKLKYAESIADLRYGIPADSESDSDEDGEEETEHTKPWRKHIQGPPAKGKRIERTKYGVRVYSCDRKTYWDFLVNNSIKKPGSAAVRVTLPPARRDGKRWHMAVFDLEAMEAIRREFGRGPQTSEVEKAVCTAKAVLCGPFAKGRNYCQRPYVRQGRK